jgi:hypothetical protein
MNGQNAVQLSKWNYILGHSCTQMSCRIRSSFCTKPNDLLGLRSKVKYDTIAAIYIMKN